jgi:signal transduction histidine kinase
VRASVTLFSAATTQQALIAQIIDSYQHGASLPRQDWQSIYQTKSLIDQNRATVAEMIGTEHRLLELRTKELKRTQMVILGVTAGLFALTLIALINVFMTTRAYAIAQEENRKLLEQRVADRTRELADANEKLKRSEEDLTLRVKERTLELEQTNAMLEAARDKAMAASALKSQFVATISHELRTPMSGVLGMAELLVDCHLAGEAEEYAKRIFQSASQLLGVLNDLLDFSKLEVGKVQLENTMFSSQALIKDVVTNLEPIAMQKNLYLQSHIESDVPRLLQGDFGRNRQILLNLTHNALKFTNSGGVTINVKAAENSADTVMIRFSIIDTGIGISPEVQLQLFQPFVQADGSTTRLYGGTGLGLSISKGLVEQMAGKIGMRSEEGQGSEFWYTVPFGLIQSGNQNLPVPSEGSPTETIPQRSPN